MATVSCMKSSDVLVMDFGNSRVKFLLNGQSISLPYSRIDTVNVFSTYLSSGTETCVYSTVNKPQSDRIVEFLSNNNIRCYDIDEFITKQKLVDFSIVQGVGNDRKLGVLGALSIISPPLITIDCGTMVTINVLSEHCTFIGGAILPGISTMLRATHDYTSALPLLQSGVPTQSIGTNTDDAIRNGVYASGIGGILYFLQRLMNNNIINASYSIAITGGEGQVIYDGIRNSIPNQVHFDQDLVLKGIVSCIDHYIYMNGFL